MINKKWYEADFETTGEDFYKQYGYVKVWLYAVCDENSEIVNYGSSMEEFMSWLRSVRGSRIYFHNLKFDGNFIIDYLLRNGYEFNFGLKASDKKGFSVLVDDMGSFYSIKINFSPTNQVEICDSLKLIPFKVEKIARDFDLPMRKGKIDYTDYTIDEDRLEYVYNDVKIVASALSELKKEGIDRLTIASSAYNYYKGSYDNRDFKRCFPMLDDDFLEKYRKAYRGGRSQVNPKYQDKVLKGVKRFDINSMYPYIMRTMSLPYGHPIRTDRMGSSDFELYELEIQFKLKKGHLPTLLKKGAIYGFESSYYTESDGIELLRISNIDFELLKRHYDILALRVIEVWSFYTCRTLFKTYIDYWYHVKLHTRGAKKALAKLMLNSLYGKFGSNNKGAHKIPALINDKVEYSTSEEEDMPKYYLPMAIAITSYAHKLIDDFIQITDVNKFVYCDTDSIHTLGDMPEEYIHPTELGKFKLEAIEEESKYIRQKCYCTKENGEYNITCAGMPDNCKRKVIEMYGDKIMYKFNIGLQVSGKLVPVRVKGGVLLRETTFEIKQ